MKKIHYLNSNLNNTQTGNQPNTESQTKTLNNKVNFKKLEDLLKRNYNSKVNNTKFEGVGSNGEYFVFNADNKKYICKCMEYTPSNLKQIEKELSVLHKIQSNKNNLKYINPCLASFITKDNIINIFPVFKGITLRKLLQLISADDFDKESRYTITKYILKQICKAIHQIHKLGISHRQLDLDSVVIELPPDVKAPFQNKSKEGFFSSLVKSFTTDDKKISKLKPSKTNYQTYRPFFNEDDAPLKVKLTNFGYGCGKTFLPPITLKNNKKTHTIKHHQNINCSSAEYLNNNDPFVNKMMMDNASKLTQKERAVLGHKYDLWCLGLIILQFITKEPNKVGEYTYTDIKKMDNNVLVNEDEYAFYLKNAQTHLLVPLAKRKSGKYVEEKINLDEKYE